MSGTDALQELTARQQITDLVSRLGRWLDDKRFDDAPSIFTADATVRSPGGSAQGIERLIAQARANHGEDETQHVITNVLIDLDGVRAGVRANLIVTFVPDRTEPEKYSRVGQRYRFEAVHVLDRWLLSSVISEPVWKSEPAGTAA